MNKEKYLVPETVEFLLSVENGIMTISANSSSTNMTVDDVNETDWNY